MLDERRRGYAVLECCQEIPCNPCVSACKTGAITKEHLNALPQFHPERCVGCKLCVAACPGQAIFYEEPDCEPGFCTITFPYEYAPLPNAGDSVTAVDRMGRAVCHGSVLAVDTRSAFQHTALVTLKIPAQFVDEVRFMVRPNREGAE